MEVFKRQGKKDVEFFIIGERRIKYFLKNNKIKSKGFNHITASKIKKELKKVDPNQLFEFINNHLHVQQKLF